VIRGERLIKFSDSWFSTKSMYVDWFIINVLGRFNFVELFIIMVQLVRYSN